MDIANALANLELCQVSDEWVKSTWEDEFYNVGELPSEYQEILQSVDVLKVLNDTITSIRLELQGVNTSSTTDNISGRISDPSITWQFLTSNDIQLKPLLPVLAHFISNGQDNIDDENLLQVCLKATSLYILLLAIPGSNAFYVFHPNIYEKALDSLKLGSTLCKHKKSKQSKSKPFQIDEDLNIKTLTVDEKANLIKGLNIVLSDFLLMINKFPLRIEDVLQKTVACLVEMTRLEVSSIIFNPCGFRTDTSVSSLSFNAYIVISNLCNPLHGKVCETVRIILWHLLPSVLMVGDFASGVGFSELCIIRSHTVHFIQYLLISVKEEAHKGICIFLQHLCIKITDKADFRQKVSQSVVDILRVLPTKPHSKLIKWLLKFAHDEKANHRLFSLEVILKLLYEEERSSESSQVIENQEILHIGSTSELSLNNSLLIQKESRAMISHRYLLGALFVHCLDSSSTVRTKALSALSDCMKSNNNIIQSMMEEIFVQPYLDMESIDNYNIVERGFMDTDVFLGSMGKATHQEKDPLPGGKAIVLKMLNLMKDTKVFVRKAALQVLENILKCNRKWMTQKLLKVLCQYCRDPALSVKKQVIQALTDLLFLYPDDPNLPEMWVESVLPQISNPETKVQEKVLEVLQELILANLAPFEQLQAPVHNLPWSLLRFIIDLKKRKFFTKACMIWARTNVLPTNLVPIIKSHIGMKNNVAAWMFLACIAQHKEVKRPQFVLDYYREMYMNETAESQFAVVQALDVLGSCWRLLKREEQDQMCIEFLDAVRGLQLGVGLIGPVLDVVTIISQGQATSPEQGQEEVSKWADDILELCISFFESQSQVNEPNAERFLRYLATLGSVAQLCPGKVKHSTVLILMGLLFPKDHKSQGVNWQALGRTPGIQAVVVITIGKVCLQDEILAKPMVRILGKLLAKSSDLAVKLNTMNALADMCIRYTALVEPFVPEMCLCLKDQSREVREGALVIIIRLLQQDYLKLRGPFFFHLLSMLCDRDLTVRELANYYFTECLLSKNKHIMHHNIVESIFHFNKYKGHELYSKINESTKEEMMFNLSGPDNRAYRNKLYRYMCEHMDDEHRMKTTHKICTDILGGITNNKVALNTVGMDVARDAFCVLSCEEIRLNQLRAQSEDEPPTEDEARVTAVVTTIKKTIIVECMKKQVLEINLPILIQLKQKLKAENSLLHNDLVSYMSDLLKDYKNEIKELLSCDKTMADEIIYDINKAEQNRQTQRRNEPGSDNEISENAADMDFSAEALIELVRLPFRLQENGSKSPCQLLALDDQHPPRNSTSISLAEMNDGDGIMEGCDSSAVNVEGSSTSVLEKRISLQKKSDESSCLEVTSSLMEKQKSWSIEKKRNHTSTRSDGLGISVEKRRSHKENVAEVSSSSVGKSSSPKSSATNSTEKGRSLKGIGAEDSTNPLEKSRSPKGTAAEDSTNLLEKRKSHKGTAAEDSTNPLEKRRSHKGTAAEDSTNLLEKRKSHKGTAAEDSTNPLEKRRSSKGTAIEDSTNPLEKRRSPKGTAAEDSTNPLEKRSPKGTAAEDSTNPLEKRRSPKGTAAEDSTNSLEKRRSPKGTAAEDSTNPLEKRRSPKGTAAEESTNPLEKRRSPKGTAAEDSTISLEKRRSPKGTAAEDSTNPLEKRSSPKGTAAEDSTNPLEKRRSFKGTAAEDSTNSLEKKRSPKGTAAEDSINPLERRRTLKGTAAEDSTNSLEKRSRPKGTAAKDSTKSVEKGNNRRSGAMEKSSSSMVKWESNRRSESSSEERRKSCSNTTVEECGSITGKSNSQSDNKRGENIIVTESIPCSTKRSSKKRSIDETRDNLSNSSSFIDSPPTSRMGSTSKLSKQKSQKKQK